MTWTKLFNLSKQLFVIKVYNNRKKTKKNTFSMFEQVMPEKSTMRKG